MENPVQFNFANFFFESQSKYGKIVSNVKPLPSLIFSERNNILQSNCFFVDSTTQWLEIDFLNLELDFQLASEFVKACASSEKTLCPHFLKLNNIL